MNKYLSSPFSMGLIVWSSEKSSTLDVSLHEVLFPELSLEVTHNDIAIFQVRT